MNQNNAIAQNRLITNNTGEIILYQPDNSIRLEVRMEEETVWLTQAQMAYLFQKDRSVITRHINNIFSEKELNEKSNVHFLHFAHSDKPVKYYSLDVIISVGYRVKSLRGTQFRRWANGVLKEYMLRGFAFQQRLKQTEDRIDRRLIEHDKKIEQLTDKVDFFVRTALPPVEGIFYDGQIFDAYAFASDLIRSAKNRDDTVYHLGASLKDLGKKLFAFSRMEVGADMLL
jgi:hypothetical protein